MNVVTISITVWAKGKFKTPHKFLELMKPKRHIQLLLKIPLIMGGMQCSFKQMPGRSAWSNGNGYGGDYNNNNDDEDNNSNNRNNTGMCNWSNKLRKVPTEQASA